MFKVMLRARARVRMMIRSSIPGGTLGKGYQKKVGQSTPSLQDNLLLLVSGEVRVEEERVGGKKGLRREGGREGDRCGEERIKIEFNYGLNCVHILHS